MHLFRLSAFLVLFMISQTALAQNDSVALAEKAFAKYAIDYSTRQAFVKYFDSNSVVFAHGEIKNGLSYWSNAKESSIKIFWRPAYTGMALSGDIGFSTGPYDVKASVKDTVLASGAYSSVWIKNSQGQWKVLIDIGTAFSPSQFNSPSPLMPKMQLLAHTGGGWKKPEQELIDQYKNKGNKAFEKFLSKSSLFNMDGHMPAATLAEVVKLTHLFNDDLEFLPVSGNTSQAGDMAYVYGQVLQKNKKGNYLRVWGYENTGWKILLQVVNW